MQARTERTGAIVLTAAILLGGLVLGGCAAVRGGEWFLAEWDTACGECHQDKIDAQGTGPHAKLGCVTCHADAIGSGHAEEPETIDVAIDWRIEGCSSCHAPQAATYLYDDNLQPGPFGGSQRDPAQPKADTFPLYAEIVAGHPFAKDYNEEGAHAFMLLDHYETTRGKFETCVQCKSTKVAYAFKTGTPITVATDVEVTLTHTQTATQTAQVVRVPAGTKVSWSSTPNEHQTIARAEFPDGTVYTSYDATDTANSIKDFNMMWAATIAATDETMPYGAGCNHCHDPHSTRERVVRSAMERAISESGVNPYIEGSPRSFDDASSLDKTNTMCAQCHVEYVCGKSGVDGIDRDFFSWSKAGDLHDLYGTTFDYNQDWVQATIGEPLIKSQHPETELNWTSAHYRAGVSCADCHMPLVRTAYGEQFRSHWFTSPYKYQDPTIFNTFASTTGVQGSYLPTPCAVCHADRTQLGKEQQLAVFERQAVVQEKLAQSSELLGEVKVLIDAGERTDAESRNNALGAHRQAHALWENLIVSENSMGFHNYTEVMQAMATAERLLDESISMSQESLGR